MDSSCLGITRGTHYVRVSRGSVVSQGLHRRNLNIFLGPLHIRLRCIPQEHAEDIQKGLEGVEELNDNDLGFQVGV